MVRSKGSGKSEIRSPSTSEGGGGSPAVAGGSSVMTAMGK